MKRQFNVEMAGYTKDNKIAKTHQANEVTAFWSKDRKFKVSNKAVSGLTLTTAKGSYKLTPHMTIVNKWTCRINNVIVHFSKKKVVAKLIYWA